MRNCNCSLYTDLPYFSSPAIDWESIIRALCEEFEIRIQTIIMPLKLSEIIITNTKKKCFVEKKVERKKNVNYYFFIIAYFSCVTLCNNLLKLMF